MRPAQVHSLTANQITEEKEGHGKATHTPGELSDGFRQGWVLLQNTNLSKALKSLRQDYKSCSHILVMR